MILNMEMELEGSRKINQSVDNTRAFICVPMSGRHISRSNKNKGELNQVLDRKPS